MIGDIAARWISNVSDMSHLRLSGSLDVNCK